MRNKFQTINAVFYYMGKLFSIFGIIFLIPLIYVLLNKEFLNGTHTLYAFLFPSLLSFSLAFLCKLIFHPASPNTFQAMIICSLGWFCFSAIGGLTYMIALNTSYLNGFFETMSGFTTTGITMFTGLDKMAKSILFWRSLTQWVGGLGIITFVIAVLSLQGGAHRLFGAEGHKITLSRPVPGLYHTLKILWFIYTGLTVLILIGLYAAGMNFFDSLCHSLTTIATGGFSPHDQSIAFFQANGYKNFKLIEYIIILGMFSGGTNFLIHYHIINRNFQAIRKNTEIRYWIGIIFFIFIIILFERFYHVTTSGRNNSIESDIRTTLFQTISIITTTGFSTQDIGSPFFGQTAKILFLVMMFIGGCVGSTGGGFKVLRISILFKLINREIKRLFASERTMSTILINSRPIEKNEVYRVSALLFSWIGLILFGGIITTLFSHHDAFKACSGMFSALGNIGPCYLSVNEMIHLHPVIKIVYILGMLAGRLEILPVLLLFKLKAWK